MAINTLAAATLFMTMLDKVAVQEATTGWMDANAGRVIYNGGDEVKIPTMALQGMGDYDRDNGYTQGSVTLKYQTKTMTQDRGRLFNLDPMDINEANFIPTASAVMGEFQRMHVVPEIDAYRLSKVATEAITAEKAGMVDYGYTPGATGTSALRAFKEGIKAVQDLLYARQLLILSWSWNWNLPERLPRQPFLKAVLTHRFLLWIVCRLFQHPLTVCILLSKSMMENQKDRNRAVMKREPLQRISTSLSAQ